MKIDDFRKLTTLQKRTMLLAMHVRNQMEDFHSEHLDDSQMKELNQIIRQAIYEGLQLFEPQNKQAKAEEVAWLMLMIPDYWEVPTSKPK
jgi:t-SNARE complex subunit (syntaxin)